MYCVAHMIPHEELRTGRKKLDRKTFVEEKTFEYLYKDTANAELFGPLVAEYLNPNDATEAWNGYWVKGDFFSNLKGHHLFEDYSDAAVNMSRVHEDGSCVLHEGQAKEKYDALKADRVADTKRADESCSTVSKSKAGSAKVLAMMQAITNGENVPDVASGNPEAAPPPSDSDGSDSEQAAPVSMFARPQPKAKSSSSSKQPTSAKPAALPCVTQRATLAPLLLLKLVRVPALMMVTPPPIA